MLEIFCLFPLGRTHEDCGNEERRMKYMVLAEGGLRGRGGGDSGRRRPVVSAERPELGGGAWRLS